MPKIYGQGCPVAQSLEFLGERWTLLVVRDLLRGPKKFQDLTASLSGVAPGVLSHRLKVLEDRGIVSRRLYNEHPPRAEYTLTPIGEELRPVVRALAVWGGRHLAAPRVLVHDRCEHPIEMAYYCPECDERIGAADARFLLRAERGMEAGAERPHGVRAEAPGRRAGRRRSKSDVN